MRTAVRFLAGGGCTNLEAEWFNIREFHEFGLVRETLVV